MNGLGSRERELLGVRLCEQAVVLRSLGRELMCEVGDMAGRMARTEDEVVRIHEAIARCGVSQVAVGALAHAARARSFAEHERREQLKWSTMGREDGGFAPDQ
jgi:hypothetical protein